MKGRPRKPTKLHILDGTFREDRHGGVEPQPQAGVPSCPKRMSADAKKIWKETIAAMEGTGVITKADKRVLARFCTAAARLEAAEEQLDRFPLQGMVNEDASAMMKRLYVIVRGETEAMRQMAVEIGLSAAARTKLGVTTDAKPVGVMTRDRSKGPPPPTKSPSAV